MNQFEAGQFIDFYEKFIEETMDKMKYGEIYSSVKEVYSNVKVQQIELVYFRNLILYLLAIYSLIFLLFIVHVSLTKFFKNKKLRLTFNQYTFALRITFSFKVPTCYR